MTRHRTFVLTGSLILGIGLAAPALAQSVDDRLSNQAGRISEGIRDGSLTAGESARLEREESALLKPLCLLTAKAAIYVANVDEKGFKNNKLLERVERYAAAARVIARSAELV
ncbi:MAG: hypothetical protein AAB253_08315, partial [candidate division NC10 bacterium]